MNRYLLTIDNPQKPEESVGPREADARKRSTAVYRALQAWEKSQGQGSRARVITITVEHRGRIPKPEHILFRGGE